MMDWIRREWREQVGPFEYVLMALCLLMLLIGGLVLDKRGPLHCTFYAATSPYCR